ncbi:hypothetical protein [Mycobacterium persicum]|uniref:hypothetical protein n=1 Tax=Mycobacterium persicum TaxID=1487726 RepID=UPI0013C2C44C|nr:hypothetical protein [Mycobacterium persicum]
MMQARIFGPPQVYRHLHDRENVRERARRVHAQASIGIEELSRILRDSCRCGTCGACVSRPVEHRHVRQALRVRGKGSGKGIVVPGDGVRELEYFGAGTVIGIR